MKDRTMVVVAGGSSTRFGSDKLMMTINRVPLIALTIQSILPTVDECVLVARASHVEPLSAMELGVTVVRGGETRTESEMCGLAAAPHSALIGVHDGARPVVDPRLVDRLFEQATLVGGAIPTLSSESTLIDRSDHQPLRGVVRVQTPQVFWGPELKAAYLAAGREGFVGHDTADVVQRFTNLEIAAVPGDQNNIKVTYPADLEEVRRRLD